MTTCTLSLVKSYRNSMNFYLLLQAFGSLKGVFTNTYTFAQKYGHFCHFLLYGITVGVIEVGVIKVYL